MTLYLISQSVNKDYDTFDSMVVSAPDEEVARQIHPYGRGIGKTLLETSSQEFILERERPFGTWALPENVDVSEIGLSNVNYEKIIIASFNAG